MTISGAAGFAWLAFQGWALAAVPDPSSSRLNAQAPDAAPDAAVDDAVADVADLRLASAWLQDDADKKDEEPSADKPRSGSRRGSGSSSGGGPSGSTAAAAGSDATPQGRTFGIGLQLGYPTGLTIKYMLRADQGIVAGIGGLSGFVYNAGSFSLHVDYVYHPQLLTRSDVFALTWYIGGGAEILVFGALRPRPFLPGITYYYYPSNMWLAARMPLGVNVAFAQQPFEIFLEATPSLLLFPGITFGLGASLGGRFYF